MLREEYKHRLVYILLFVSTIPFFAIVNPPEFQVSTISTFDSLSFYGSAVAGYIGVSMLLWQLILGTRSITGRLISDTPWTLKLHSRLGKYGSLFIFLHPILILIASSESLLYLVYPAFSTSYDTYVTLGRISFLIVLLVWITSAIARGKLSYRVWKKIHMLSYVAIFFALLHAPEVGSSFSNKPIQIIWYSFVLLFIICSALRLRHLFGFGKLRYEIVDNKSVADGIYLVRMKPKKRFVSIKMSQYVYVQLGLGQEEHPFTVLDSGNDGILIAYKRVGKFTRKLSNKNRGDVVLLDGPYGRFTHQISMDKKKPAVFIAGGIGITPFVAHILRSSEKNDYFLFYVNQTKDSGAFRGLMRKKLGDRYIDVFSKESVVEIKNQETGRMSEDILNKYVPNLSLYTFYVCGPKPMMDNTKDILKRLGVGSKAINLEEFEF